MPIHQTGVHGDPLAEGKLDLPELREAPSVADLASAREFIATRRWREASTYRNTAPHDRHGSRMATGAAGPVRLRRVRQRHPTLWLRRLLLPRAAPLLGHRQLEILDDGLAGGGDGGD